MHSRQIDISPEVITIAQRLQREGYDTWCVGGAVRDFLLQVDNNDFDLATAATPKQVQRLFRRTVPVGIEHGTVAVLDSNNVAHEVTTFRRDIRTDGRHAEVEFGVSLEEDLSRRDFTINSIAYHPTRHEWKDPHDGIGDIERGLVRAVGTPATRFKEDYLRILRCVRFATRFGFRVEGETWRSAKDNAAGLKRLSAERVRDEWFKSLITARSVATLCRYWSEIGADEMWLPGIHLDYDITKDRAARLDAGGHGDAVLATAYLSAAPPETLHTLRCSRAEIERGRRIDRHRGQWPNVATPISVRRWMADARAAVDDLIGIAELDDNPRFLRNAVNDVRASGAPLSPSDLAVDGADLLKAGISEGPRVGEMLKRLLDVVLETPERNTRDTLLRIAVEVKHDA